MHNEKNIVSVENSWTPVFSEGKLFYFTIDEVPTVGKRYFLNQNREIAKFITKGISCFAWDVFNPLFPQVVTLDGQQYNTIDILDTRHIHFTWYGKDRNWIEYHKPLFSFLEFPFVSGNPLQDVRNYNHQILPSISYYQYVDNAFATPFPIAIPFMFYW